MGWRARLDERGIITRFSNTDTGEVISAQEYERRMQMMQGGYTPSYAQPGISSYGSYYAPPVTGYAPSPAPANNASAYSANRGYYHSLTSSGKQAILTPDDPGYKTMGQSPMTPMASGVPFVPAEKPSISMAPAQSQALPAISTDNPLIQPGAQILTPGSTSTMSAPASIASSPEIISSTNNVPMQGKNLRLEGVQGHLGNSAPAVYRPHGFLDATSIAILLPTLILIALSIAAAHKKRLFPWQTIRTFNPPSGLMSPRDYEKSYLCPPNLRRHGRLGRRNPNATWTDADGVVVPFGFLARTHLPVTIPLGRLPNKNMFIVAPSGSGKTTLMRAIIKALMAKPCVIIALEAKANDPHLDEKKEGFKYTVLPEAKAAGFDTLYFNPLDTEESIHWNPLDLPPITFASSIVQDINRLAPEEQHWAERDHGYIAGLTQLLKWGAVQVAGEDEEGFVSEVIPLSCNPRGLMKLVNNRRNIVESLRRLKNNPEVDAAELSELTQTLSSIIRTDTDWDKNIQGVRGRLRMFKNPSVLRVTEQSNVDIQASMHKPTVLIFGAPASLGPDAESLAACFVYQLQQALHTRYGIASILPLFAFFDEYQTLNLDIAGRLSAIVRGANGGLTVILQNVSQITGGGNLNNPANTGSSELRTIFSNAAVRVCLHNADESTSRFFSDEIGKHAVIVPGLSDHFKSNGFGTFPTSWNRIHSQQVVARVDTDSIKRMEKHHGLVYLSPAGDPEFGEVKPLMVDLRGIEEIARLHLLYNVAGRRTPSDGQQAAMPPMPTHVPWQSNLGTGSWTTAAVDTAAQTMLSPMVTGGNIVPAASASISAVGKLADTLTNAMPGVLDGTVSGIGDQTANNIMPAISGSGINGEASGLCPSCKQPAGNKKFCTNCGTFLVQPAAISSTTPSVAAITNQSVNLETMGTIIEQSRLQSSRTAQPVTAAPQFPFASTTPTNPTMPTASAAASNTIQSTLAGAFVSNQNKAAENTSGWAEGSTWEAKDDLTLQSAKGLRQSYTQTVNQDAANPVARKPITSLNPELGRPVPKAE